MAMSGIIYLALIFIAFCIVCLAAGGILGLVFRKKEKKSQKQEGARKLADHFIKFFDFNPRQELSSKRTQGQLNAAFVVRISGLEKALAHVRFGYTGRKNELNASDFFWKLYVAASEIKEMSETAAAFGFRPSAKITERLYRIDSELQTLLEERGIAKRQEP